MFKVTTTTYTPSEDTGPGTLDIKTVYLTEKELEEFSKTHEEFNVEKIKWEPSRED